MTSFAKRLLLKVWTSIPEPISQYTTAGRRPRHRRAGPAARAPVSSCRPT